MKQIDLWYDDKKNKYYSGDQFQCFECGEDIYNSMVLATYWDRKKSSLETYCPDCANKIKSHSIISEFKIVSLMDPSRNATPVIIRPTGFKGMRDSIDVCGAAELQSIKTIDNTKLAGKESIEGAKIGMDIKEAIGEKDSDIDISEIDGFLSDLKEAKPEIKEYKKKHIEKK